VAAYVGGGACQAFDYGVLNDWPAGVPLDAFLEGRGINLVYLDEKALRGLEGRGDRARPFVDGSGTTAWRLLGRGDEAGGRWRLFRRSEPPASP
jgi:hypothetical protein